ncbi:TSUP family transporter [Sphingomonas canadensis]|uniref:Probable membrane transporter protein n=1 Tax=Sphingomonas canadensis TaxID=1219257 RepID=A0ABW3H728_9SPHN|nr:sulfite exporter TauE/SafE family protein [Sphingomonas canadensis]MCW3835890.1 sulfite exporter TauE/SafE family protein [Sphingomonas canadensis]
MRGIVRGFFESRIFCGWWGGMMLLWVALFALRNSIPFLIEHWYYPAIMVLGAFIAGLTPEGGGAAAFPVLSVFLDVKREMARDFSLMIQSVGMTSASIWILSQRGHHLPSYAPVLWFVPVSFLGFVFGMQAMQAIPVYIIQALFLSLILTFTLAYISSKHRGELHLLHARGFADHAMLAAVLFAGGIAASLFGTGADIAIYTLLVTRFRMDEKVATHISIMLMAAISILGCAYRFFWDGDVTDYQVRTWLCAYPVVLFMAPFGSYVLSRLNVEWMLRAIVALNIFQIAYFNLKNPTWAKLAWSTGFSVVLFAVFWFSLARIVRQTARRRAAGAGA